MKFREKTLRYLLALMAISLISLPQTSFASELPDESDWEYITLLNANANMENPPIVVKKGKVDKSEQIASLEDAILNSSISAGAAKFLLENSPETVRPIKKSLENQLKESNKLLKEARALLKEMKPADKKEDKNIAQLKDAYMGNLVMISSARMLLESTPQTVRKVEKKLKNQVIKSEDLIREVEAIIYEKEMKDFYKVRPLERKSTGLYFKTPSEAEILNYWRAYESQSENKRYFDGIYLVDPYTNLYQTMPDLANNNPGMLKDEVQKDINHLTNTARFASGLHPVGLNQEYSYYAQASSVINSLNNVLTHWPRAPKGYANDHPLYLDGYYGSGSSNIAQGYNALRQIYAYVMDDDNENWDFVGHRAALLSPTANKVGYGYYENFSAQFVWGDQFMETGDEIVTFPSNVGIAEFFNENTPFTINLKDKYDISNVLITMTNLKTGEVLQYKTNYNIFTVDEELAGNMKSLSWGLGHPGNHGDQYLIKVGGIKKDGKPYPIEYTVNFISLEYGHTN